MGYRSSRRPRKFYQQQVTQVLALLDNYFREDQLPLETYLSMCEQLGKEPDLDEIPPDLDDFPMELQEAFMVHHLLPDRWDGSSGSYLGKDWSALEMLLTELEIIERRQCILFIKHIEARNSNKINKELARERKKAENKAKRR